MWEGRSCEASPYPDQADVPHFETLSVLLVFNERHLRRTVAEFAVHYNRARPHTSLGPGIPEPTQAKVPATAHRHMLPAGFSVASTPVLGGLHHEYRLEKEAA